MRLILLREALVLVLVLVLAIHLLLLLLLLWLWLVDSFRDSCVSTTELFAFYLSHSATL